ncbi:phosphate butyryltransferase [Sedimentibacter sp. zth1]|uniref:phosphate butyryltransferase n=1 Tax=Sedimentibacter sp. zth1 TaxID=2816908 RepID=UPI001A92A7BB|nr:phosphate butyryltransferase [Sedimentibacter sp. zth1]QSX06185.1 phosphate butyryltransferase [Sedimentibacter sp. zth1]
MKNFNDVLMKAKDRNVCIAVAAAHDKEVLSAIKMAIDNKLIVPILVGNKVQIQEYSKEINLDLTNIEIIDETDIKKCSEIAVKLVHEKKAKILMKGLVDTSIILKEVLNKEYGLRTDSLLSHAAIFQTEKYHKLLFITDAAMNLAPNANDKKKIIDNVVKLVHSLSISNPKVAVVCAKEKVNPKMIATVDAQELVERNRAGEIKGCVVGGPFALDNAISKEAATHKGITDPVAGDADILLMPDIEAGNILYKSLAFLSNTKNAGILLGAAAPIVLTSRADTDEAKLNSIALAVMYTSL